MSYEDLYLRNMNNNIAGGKFTNLDGEAGPHGASAISSNGLLHGDFIKEIK